MTRGNGSKASPGALPDWMMGMLGTLRDELAICHGQARRRAAARAGQMGLLRWGRTYLGEHFRRRPSRMHLWLGHQLDAIGRHGGTKLNVLAPRGAAKSTLGTLAYPLRAALEGRQEYIWIVSDTKHQAQAHLKNIQRELVGNPRLKEQYPRAAGRGPIWRVGAIVLRNGVAIEAFGTGQRIRGHRHGPHRPTLIVCDDLQNDSHISSAQARARSRTWFHGTLLKAGNSRTDVINLATALHQEALAMELERTPGWTSKVFRAITRWPEKMSLWEAWEAIYTDVRQPDYKRRAERFYRQHRQAMEAGVKLLWPEEEDLYGLMCMRAESGHTAFAREKQNSPINPQECEWPESYFDETIWFESWPRHLRIRTLALDPSKGSDSRRGDYSAYVKLGLDRQGILYLEADMARRPTPRMVADGVALHERFRPDAFGIEANQFQDLLAGEFEAEFRRRGLLGVRPWLIDNRVNKQVRIRRLGPHLAAGRLRFKGDSPSTRMLVEQLKTFPLGDHDDGPDAAEMALRLAAELLGKPAARDALGDRLPVG